MISFNNPWGSAVNVMYNASQVQSEETANGLIDKDAWSKKVGKKETKLISECDEDNVENGDEFYSLEEIQDAKKFIEEERLREQTFYKKLLANRESEINKIIGNSYYKSDLALKDASFNDYNSNKDSRGAKNRENKSLVRLKALKGVIQASKVKKLQGVLEIAIPERKPKELKKAERMKKRLPYPIENSRYRSDFNDQGQVIVAKYGRNYQVSADDFQSSDRDIIEKQRIESQSLDNSSI